MVFTGYIIDKYVHNLDAVLYMKSSETEPEAYLDLGIKMKEQPDHLIRWSVGIEDINLEDDQQENKFRPLIKVVTEQQDFECIVDGDPTLMKLFCQYFKWLEKYGPSDETSIHFGVNET